MNNIKLPQQKMVSVPLVSVKAGDKVTLVHSTPRGEVFTIGTAYTYSGMGDRLYVGGYEVTTDNFESATRPVPVLPRSHGTVLNATVRGVRDVRVMRGVGSGWTSSREVNGWTEHSDNDITDWTVLIEGECGD